MAMTFSSPLYLGYTVMALFTKQVDHYRIVDGTGIAQGKLNIALKCCSN